MSRMYYWIYYDSKKKKYSVSGTPCIEMNEETYSSLSIVRDISFSGKVTMGKTIKLKLVSVPKMMHFYAQKMILQHFNSKNKNSCVSIIRDIEIPIPKNMNELISSKSSDEWCYDTSNFYSGRSMNSVTISSGDFTIRLNYYDEKDKKSYFYFSHPYIKIKKDSNTV